MRKLHAMGAAALLAAGQALAAEEPFDACTFFTQSEAEKALGTPAAPEPVNPKVKRPKVVTTCAYHGVKDGRPVEARAQYRIAKNDAEAQHAFDDAKLKLATKPMLLPGVDQTFWSAKTGEMNVRKGRTWIVVSVGSPKATEREMDSARGLAEVLARKL